MIRIITMKCPGCNAPVDIESGQRVAYCNYCGTRFLIKDDYDEILKEHQRERDFERREAERRAREDAERRKDYDELRKLEEERKILEEERKRAEQKRRNLAQIREKRKKLILTCFPIIIVSCFLGSVFSLFFIAAFIVTGILIIDMLKLTTEQNKIEGKIKFPVYQNLEHENAESIAAALRGMGFTNVNLVNKRDLILGVLKRPGSVDSINVNGQTESYSNKWYNANVSIIITFHGYP